MSNRLRAFTTLEVGIVLVVGTVLTTAGLVAAADVIREARYRADRARLYGDIKEARNTGANSLTAIRISEGATVGTVSFELVENDCATVIQTLEAEKYPALDFGGNACRICIRPDGNTETTCGTNHIDFSQAGEPDAPAEEVAFAEDGRVDDSWGEFPDEGAFEMSNSNDIDSCDTCGDATWTGAASTGI